MILGKGLIVLQKIFVFILFCAGILVCTIFSISILYALLFGLLIFVLFAHSLNFSWKEILKMCLTGLNASKSILITFIFIGTLTALWRISGCIPSIVCYASGLIRPEAIIILSFLLNCLVSVLTGTAFGTAATMGVICVSIAKSMNAPLVWVGGAVLSGVFFGDRCSPVSTSSLLVSELTGTDIYRNIRNMVKTALIPFLVTCIIYTVVGFISPSSGTAIDVNALFHESFEINFICLLPAVLIIVLAVFQLNVKWLMLSSILASLPIAYFVQDAQISDILHSIFCGYRIDSSSLSGMINGGGIVSMLKVSAIVGVASCYSGIFEKTELLSFMKAPIENIYRKVGSAVTTLLISIPVSAISCNQTLAILLTDQLASDIKADPEKKALNLENTAVIVAPLIPWSIAGTVPLTSSGSPMTSILFACYLYLLPLIYAALDKGRQIRSSHKIN